MSESLRERLSEFGLTEKQRRVYIVRRRHGLSYRELAKHLGISPQSVMQLHRRAEANVGRLKQLVISAGGDPAEVDAFLSRTVLMK
jgi:DNA-directed RNA polymerase specialized sigma24 family protein